MMTLEPGDLIARERRPVWAAAPGDKAEVFVEGMECCQSGHAHKADAAPASDFR